MNTTNHNRIIAKVTEDDGIKGILEKASAYVDNPMPPGSQYYFYHFYYNIHINGNTIQLLRIDENAPEAYEQSMKMCGNKYDLNKHQYYDDLSIKSELVSFNPEGKRKWSCNTDKKEFFSTFINERDKSPKFEFGDINFFSKGISGFGNNTIFDIGNQSDNVAFLHAMGAANESKDSSLSEFKKHLRKCFAEYLFIADSEKATYMLGIALHGIMDSFTPSHMDFQKFSEQDWGFHAQGDVIPFDGDKVVFIPGQFSDASKGEKYLATIKKGYDGDDIINSKEFEMFKIFLKIGDINEDNAIIKALLEDKADIAVTMTSPTSIKSDFETTITYHSLDKLNKYLEQNGVKFGDNAFDFSEAAIDVCRNIYSTISEKKSQICNYRKYKENKDSVIDDVIRIWVNKYDEEDEKNKKGLKSKRKELLDKIKKDGKIAFAE